MRYNQRQDRRKYNLDITICRQSICKEDDLDSHTCTYTIDQSTRFSSIFKDLIEKKYFPDVLGNDAVWTLCCGKDDLISWKTKDNKFYSRFVDGEPPILRVKRWAASASIHFCYCSSSIERARQIFTMFNGLKFHIWHEGFMSEYESYHISQAIEDEWRRSLTRR